MNGNLQRCKHVYWQRFTIAFYLFLYELVHNIPSIYNCISILQIRQIYIEIERIKYNKSQINLLHYNAQNL